MLLDTSAYSELARGSKSAAGILKGNTSVLIPIQVVGELRYGFRLGSQNTQNEQNLQRFLAQSQVQVVSPSLQTTTVYAEMATLCRQLGKALSHNDLWIAALAKEHNQQLITYDKDFAVFERVLGKNLSILTDC